MPLAVLFYIYNSHGGEEEIKERDGRKEEEEKLYAVHGCRVSFILLCVYVCVCVCGINI